METRANYALIGAFTLAGVLGAFAFLLWLAKIDVDRQYAYYDVLFESVSGLGMAGDVRYNGLPVGSVVGLDLDEENPSLVRVRLEIDAETPVKTDTVAQLQSLGVTGVSFVSLSGGSAEAARLPRDGVIQSERSALQTIFEGAPELLEKAIALLEDVRSVVSDDNRAAVGTMLDNLASASGRLDQALADFESLSDDLGLAAREIAEFTGRLEQLSDTAEVTLNEATETLVRVRDTLDSAEGAFDTADGLMREELKEFIQRGADAASSLDGVVTALEPSAIAALEAAQGLIETRLPELIDQLQDTAEVLETQVDTVGTDASALMARYSEVGAEVQARVAQAEGAIAAFETASVAAAETLDAVTATSNSAGETIALINRTVEEDLPGLLEDVRGATQTANRVIDEVGAEIAGAGAHLDEIAESGGKMLATATETFENANGTLAAITQAMDSADVTLGTANETFEGVNSILDEDVEKIVADIRGAVQAVADTVDSVADNIASASDEILAASESASSLAGTVDGIVQENRRPLSDFMRVGLPQFTRFVEESRLLVKNLERLVDRVERDPARFLLGTQASEFRR